MRRLFNVIAMSVCLAVPTFARQDSLMEHHLQEVVVVAKLPPVEYSAGKQVYRPDAFITQGSGSVADLLTALPGVMVGDDGVLLYGKPKARILLDGKTTYLSGTEIINLLRATPASQVEKVEVVTQPSARHEAEGTGGVIDIRLRKQKRRGINLAINGTGSFGVSGYGTGSLSANLRTEKANFFATYSYYDGRQQIDMDIRRVGELERMTQNACQRRHNRSHYAQIGTDWEISPRTTWSVILDGNLWSQDEWAEMYSELPSAEAERTKSHSQPSRKHLTASTSLAHRLPADRGEVTGSFDYFRYHRAEPQAIHSSQWPAMIGDNEGDINLISTRVDGVNTPTENWKLSWGVKANRARVSNRSDYHQEEELTSPTKSDYTESIRTAYLQSEYGVGRWNGIVGLRVEQTEFNRLTATHLFPSLFGRYEVRSDNLLQLSYTRRISRPGYESLSPFVHVIDRYTYETGNPSLRSAYSDNVELEYIHRKSLHASLFISLTDDEIQTHYSIDGEWTARVAPLNFNSHLQYGVRMSASEITLAPWWTAHATVQLVYDRYRWEEPGEGRRENAKVTPSIHLMSQFALPAKWQAECTILGQGRMAMGQTELRQMWEVRLGVQRKLFGGSGTLRLFVNDLFNSNYQSAEFPVGRLKASLKIAENKRVVGIAFSWRFQKGTATKEKKHSQTLEEKKRVL